MSLIADCTLMIPHTNAMNGHPQDPRSVLDMRFDIRNLLHAFQADILSDTISAYRPFDSAAPGGTLSPGAAPTRTPMISVWTFTAPNTQNFKINFKDRVQAYMNLYGTEVATFLCDDSPDASLYYS